MSFEFELVPLKGVFTPEDHAMMRAWWEQFPVWTDPAGNILVFKNDEIRQIRLDRWRNNPGRNDYLTPYVKFFEDGNVQLSVVGDETDQWFHDFAVWCQQGWPCELRYLGQPVPASELLAGPDD
jgi:hypothetical protein